MCLILLAWASLAWGGGLLEPPLPPLVPPTISETYPEDLDGNRIDDALESDAGGISVASAEMVEVELIFNEPVTPRQIDDFLLLDGRITYIFEAISYGWNGSIARQYIDALPAIMGSSLVQVEGAKQLRYCMDTATQVGRVRPVWKAGFAGVPGGLRGNANTTILFLGSGVDPLHPDLRGRNVYWKDFSWDHDAAPADYEGHETQVAGVATGTGGAGGAEDGELRFTFAYTVFSRAPFGYLTDPVTLPDRPVTMTSRAWWTGQTATLEHWRWTRGTDGADSTRGVGTSLRASSPAVLTNSFTGSPGDLFSTVLADWDNHSPMADVTIVTSITPYPGVGDGQNTFSGVAPGCKWGAVKVFPRIGQATTSGLTQGLDDILQKSVEKNIKIVNISLGYHVLGESTESASIRDKVNTLVNNGVIVVVSAGNEADIASEAYRKMGDPARAAQAITVGASNDENALTDYSMYGFTAPRTNAGEDFKPDLIAPGGSFYYTGIMSVDSSTSDGAGVDREPNDYASAVGTSFSAPFVSGCAALVIDAMQAKGTLWKFGSSDHPRYVKMLLCATATETNTPRESKLDNPTLNRAAPSADGFPAGKDRYEGYGMINPDAAVEAVCQTFALGSTATAARGGSATAKRACVKTMTLTKSVDVDLTLDNPPAADFDLYLYSAVPTGTGTPTLLAASAKTGVGQDESLHYTPTAAGKALLVVKRVAGAGTFTLRSTQTQAGPPTATSAQVTGGINSPVTITLTATDDGRPIPPGALSYTVASLPKHGRLESPTTGAVIKTVPAKLTNPADKVVYRPNQNWVGDDSFTFYAHDGGTAPLGGQSNTATVKITIVREITVEYQVADGMDDAYGIKWGVQQMASDPVLLVGQYAAGLRFRGVQVPQGAQIMSATLKIHSYLGGLTGYVDGVIQAQAVDNSQDFSEQTISAMTRTSASKPWVLATEAPWSADTWYESPDISNVVQEVVGRSGWASNNALTIIFWTSSYYGYDRRFSAYERSPASAAKLVVTYQPKQ